MTLTDGIWGEKMCIFYVHSLLSGILRCQNTLKKHRLNQPVTRGWSLSHLAKARGFFFCAGLIYTHFTHSGSCRVHSNADGNITAMYFTKKSSLSSVLFVK